MLKRLPNPVVSPALATRVWSASIPFARHGCTTPIVTLERLCPDTNQSRLFDVLARQRFRERLAIFGEGNERSVAWHFARNLSHTIVWCSPAVWLMPTLSWPAAVRWSPMIVRMAPHGVPDYGRSMRPTVARCEAFTVTMATTIEAPPGAKALKKLSPCYVVAAVIRRLSWALISGQCDK